ncbi:hypothetical protein RI367_003698 [Sorochytrium milnesiophthora]
MNTTAANAAATGADPEQSTTEYAEYAAPSAAAAAGYPVAAASMQRVAYGSMPPAHGQPPQHYSQAQYAMQPGVYGVNDQAPDMSYEVDQSYVHASLMDPAYASVSQSQVSFASYQSGGTQYSLPMDGAQQDLLASAEPEDHLEYARQLLQAAETLPPGSDNPKVLARKQAAYQQEAVKMLKRLSEKGINKSGAYPPAMVFLAECYGNGTGGLTVDHDKAFSLYQQASKLGHAAAAYRVAVCYEIGAGTKRDPTRSKDYYRKAAVLGDPPAMYKLALILLDGSPREAVTWLKRAASVADASNPHALHELGMLYEKGLEEGNVIMDHAYARELYTQAAQFGYAPSQYRLGVAYEHGELTCFVDPKRSISWYTRAAEQGHPEAELALSGWFLTGCEGVLVQNDTQAYAWARRAADKGLSKAEYAIGYYCEMGVGAPQDLDEARRWYQRAAAQSNRKAMQRLQELKQYGRALRSERPAKDRSEKGDCVVM